jgi:hypothetical protein
MEYQQLKKLKEKFVTRTDEVILTNPIEKYNYVIQNYNINYNKIDNIELDTVPFHSLYTVIFLIQSKILNYFLLLVVIPAMLLVGREYLHRNPFIFNIVIHFYYLLLNVTCLSGILLYIYAKQVYHNNFIQIENPFRKMIYHPDICRNILNKHLELTTSGNINLNIENSEELTCLNQRLKS